MNYFEKETPCPCCGMNNADPELIRKLNFARELYGKAIKATSICRCAKHNEEVLGKSNSAHLYGKAADLLSPNSEEKLTIINAAIMAGFKRVIVYRSKRNLIHVDIDTTKPQGLIVET